MKHLKTSMYLLLTAAIFTSCEKEMDNLPASPEMNVQETAPSGQPTPNSISEIIKSGIDMETYFNSRPKPENTVARPAYSQIQNPNLQFFYSSEGLPCNNLPTEDFEDANYYNGYVPNYLNENSNNSVFSPGDIMPGISFELTRNYDYYGPEYDFDWSINNYGFYNWTEPYFGLQNALMSNYEFTDLTINFSGNNVTNVSMNLLNWNYTNEIIEIYGLSGNLIGTDVVWVNYSYGTFWSVQSLVPISKIVIKSEYYWGYEGVDNVSFGACNDFDGDGVLNVNDAHPNSDMREKMNIGGSNTNIDNKMVKNGSTMMDQLNDLIAQTNSQYYGENYDYHHKRFMTKLAQLTYNWRTARLITSTQRSQISSIAWSATIPFQGES